MYLLKRLKKKWFQTLIIFLVFLLISALIYIGLSISNSNDMFETMMERSNASHTLLLMDSGLDDDAVKNQLKEIEQVESVHSTPIHIGEILAKTDDGEFGESVMISAYGNDTLDKLFSDSEQTIYDPKINEVYINYNFSNSRKLYKNDEVQLVINGNQYTFVVKEVIVDPHFTTPFMSPTRVFVRSDFFTQNNISPNKHIFGLRFENVNALQDDLYESLNRQFSSRGVIIIDYDDFKLSYSIIQGVISSVLLVVSFLIFVISMIIIRNVIDQNILQKYKEIGVMKTLGFTKVEIQKYFMDQYILIGVVASIIGVLIGFPLRKMINNQLSNELKVGIGNPLDLNLVLTPIIVLTMIITSVYFITRQTRSIKPAQAIKYGMPEKDSKTSQFDISQSKMPLVLSLAYKQVLMGKRNFIIIVTIALLMFASSTIYNIGYTMEQSSHFASHLLGVEVGDFAFNISELSPEKKEWLENLEGVENINYFELVNGSIIEDSTGNVINISKLIVTGDESKILLASGRYPETDNEVIISSMIARLSGKDLGDYLEIESENHKKRFLITGIQNSVINSSKTYITNEKSQGSSIFGFVWGYGQGDISALDQVVKEHLGDDNSVTRFDGNVKNILSTLESFPGIIRIILVVFMGICCFIFVNLTIMEVNQGSKDYGIMKAIGFSNTIIQRILVIKTIFVTTVGAGIGIVLSFLFSSWVLVAVFKITPFASIKMPIRIDYFGSVIILFILLMASYISVWLPSLRIKKISPKQLMTE